MLLPCTSPAGAKDHPAAPSAVAQALASFNLQEQDLLLSHSFPRLALALCTLQEAGAAKSLPAVEGTVPPLPAPDLSVS